MHKFDNPVRTAELSPAATLLNIGLKKDDVFCDIGAGTGIFTIEAAKITDNTTYAIDLSESMLEIIANKCKVQNIENVIRINPNGFSYPLAVGECDFALACTVFHEIDDKTALLKEIYRILKPQGKLVIIEFFCKETPFGPPITNRISAVQTKKIAEENAFVQFSQTTLGENFYLSEFSKDSIE